MRRHQIAVILDNVPSVSLSVVDTKIILAISLVRS